MTTIRSMIALAAFSLAGACYGGSGTADTESSSAPSYTKTCARTFCDVCRDQVSSNCSQCTSLCSRPGAYSGCSGDCSDLCSSTCSACSGPSSCEQWEVDLPLPVLDSSLFDSCLRANEACRPGAHNRSYCDYVARTMRPETVAQFECELSRACDARAECSNSGTGAGTLGSSLCERSERCGGTCDESTAGFLNRIEDTMRPELKRSLQQCIAEPSCAEFRACAYAHDALWKLDWKKDVVQ